MTNQTPSLPQAVLTRDAEIEALWDECVAEYKGQADMPRLCVRFARRVLSRMGGESVPAGWTQIGHVAGDEATRYVQWGNVASFDFPLGAVVYAAAPTAPAQQAADVQGEPRLPDGWVPLRIAYARDEDPEDVAFGPKRMMDRLKKWLDNHFASLAAAQSVPKGGTIGHSVPEGGIGPMTASLAASAPTVGGDADSAVSAQDLHDSIKAIFDAVGYTEAYAMQWPKEKVSVTFRRWFDEQIALATQEPSAAAEPVAPVDLEQLTQLIADRLSGTYHCTRVWEAWRVGTMSQDDFEDVGESDTPAELAAEIVSLLATPPTPPSAPAGAGEGERS